MLDYHDPHLPFLPEGVGKGVNCTDQRLQQHFLWSGPNAGRICLFLRGARWCALLNASGRSVLCCRARFALAVSPCLLAPGDGQLL